MEITANIIAFLHLILVILVISTPFLTDNLFILLFYCFMVFSIMLHWITSNDMCILTLIESKLRNKKTNQTFMGRLIGPVYNVSKFEVRIVTLALFLFALYKTHIWERDKLNEVIAFANLQFLIFKKNINKVFTGTGPAAEPAHPVWPLPQSEQQPSAQEIGGEHSHQEFHPVPIP
jgi:hypothetical protein